MAGNPGMGFNTNPNDPVSNAIGGFFRRNLIAPMKRGYSTPGGSESMGFRGQNAQQQGHALAAQAGVNPPAPSPAPVASPEHGSFGAPSPSTHAFAAPSAPQVPTAQARPAIGIGKPPEQGFRSVGIAQAQVPQGGFENKGDPAHQLHPLVQGILSSPQSMQPPQYTNKSFFLGDTTDPYPAMNMAMPGMGFNAENHANKFMPGPQGPSGPSFADMAMQGLHAQAGLTHAQGQAEMSHGMAEHYLAESKDPTGMNRMTPEGLHNAERMQAMRTGMEVQHTPWEGNPTLTAAVANPNFNVGILRRAAQASGVNMNTPEGMNIISQILAIKGLDPEEEYRSNSGGRSPLNGLEFGGGAVPWFPNFKQYQSPESQANQQFLAPFRR